MADGLDSRYIGRHGMDVSKADRREDDGDGLLPSCALQSSSDDLHAELAMIDENLCRAELSPADRAVWTARRMAIYIELHPETEAGVAGATARWDATDNLSTASFAAETAKLSGKEERTVRRDAERGEKVIDEAINLIRGTKLTGEDGSDPVAPRGVRGQRMEMDGRAGFRSFEDSFSLRYKDAARPTFPLASLACA